MPESILPLTASLKPSWRVEAYMTSVELSVLLRWPGRRVTKKKQLVFCYKKCWEPYWGLQTYHIPAHQSGPCWTPPQHSTGRSSTRWSTGCAGGKLAPLGPLLSQTNLLHDSTELEFPLTAQGHGTPERSGETQLDPNDLLHRFTFYSCISIGFCCNGFKQTILNPLLGI